MSKKLFNTIVVLLLVMGQFVAALPTGQVQAQTNTSDTSWYGTGGAGPFYISSADELAGLAQLVNDGTDNFAGKTIYLDENIDLISHTNWEPIGGTESFAGVFDGQFFTISNLTSNRPDQDMIGLFGTVSGTVQNFTLSGVSITGREQVGGVSGRLYPDGTINTVTVQNVTIDAKHYAGGIAGYVYGQLSGVHANSVTIALTYDTDAGDNGDKWRTAHCLALQLQMWIFLVSEMLGVWLERQVIQLLPTAPL